MYDLLSKNVTLSKKSYESILQNIEVPTDIQTRRFVDHVSSHHSWYKHLSKEEPSKFVFYLDPGFEYLNNNKKFSEAELKQAREYSRDYGTWMYVRHEQEWLGPQCTNEVFVIDSEGRKVLLPEDIVQRCTLGVTALIHPMFKNGKTVAYANQHIKVIEQLQQHLIGLIPYFKSLINTIVLPQVSR
jgi:hypothetical protein